MMGPSKILTVSYGTFSCTLEGFDEPFSTMRGIAEYFRDLAADDRYFGAEPPTPDAEMLHRIAQRDVVSRVEAQVEDNGIVLRQVESETAETPEPQVRIVEEPEPAPVVAPIIAAVVAETTIEAIETVVDDPVDVPPLSEEIPTASESVAAKLARIRAVVAADQESGDTEVEDEPDSMFDTSPISAAFADDAEDAVQPNIVQAFSTEEEYFSQDETDDIELTAEPEQEPDLEAEEAFVEPEFEAEAVDDVEAEAEDEVEAEVEAEIEAEAEFEDEVEAEVAEAPVEVADEAEFETEDDFAEVVAEDEATEVEADEEEAGPEEGSVSRIMGAISTDEVEIDDIEADAIEDPDKPAIARVIKMRREDFEAALDSGEVEEISEQDDIVEAEAEADIEAEAEPESSLSPEDEAELMANLEQVQRKADADVRSEKEGRALLENQDIEDDPESVSRLMDVTDTEMEETEGTRRRSAIAHLKAAVAATRADKLFTKQREEEDENELNQYRDDLAKVVRPRRPAEAGAPSRRVAPLVLVSEQRVDESQAEHADDGAVVRPRRVTSGNLALSEDEIIEVDEDHGENIFTPAQSFAEFASDMGADELPDLLEAAAAYSAYVEGQDHFSRPQIMKAVAELNPQQEFTREEGLRSFGLLLRRGKIKKLKRGQFAIAATTRFNPEIRAVGE